MTGGSDLKLPKKRLWAKYKNEEVMTISFRAIPKIGDASHTIGSPHTTEHLATHHHLDYAYICTWNLSSSNSSIHAHTHALKRPKLPHILTPELRMLNPVL